VRRPALGLLVLLLAGCSSSVPGGHVTTPTPETVIGKVPKPPTIVANPAAGKALFVSQGCGACHTFAPAGTNGKVGPSLDNLAASAKAANQGSLDDFIMSSIVDPNAYIAPGYKANIMPPNFGTTLTPAQIADLVAFLSKGS
jgi:mono/diheme cytochrome c family protein